MRIRTFTRKFSTECTRKYGITNIYCKWLYSNWYRKKFFFSSIRIKPSRDNSNLPARIPPFELFQFRIHVNFYRYYIYFEFHQAHKRYDMPVTFSSLTSIVNVRSGSYWSVRGSVVLFKQSRWCVRWEVEGGLRETRSPIAKKLRAGYKECRGPLRPVMMQRVPVYTGGEESSQGALLLEHKRTNSLVRSCFCIALLPPNRSNRELLVQYRIKPLSVSSSSHSISNRRISRRAYDYSLSSRPLVLYYGLLLLACDT